MQNTSGQITILLVFLAVFGTVAPEQVLGNDTLYIQNVVQSSSNTGGRGQDGQDGVDGTDGQDGTPGQSGQSVTTEGASSAHIKLTNIVDGSVDTYVVSSTTGDASVSHGTDTEEDVESVQTTDPTPATAQGEASVTHVEQSQFHLIIISLQKLIERYVNLLF